MVRLPTDILQPGMILAKSVINERGQVLLRQNLSLTPDYINLLKRRGFASVYISDGNTQDVLVEDILSQEIQLKAQTTLVTVFDFVQQVSSEFDHRSGESLRADLRDHGVANALRGHDGFRQLEQVVTTILDNLVDTDTFASIAQIRNHDDLIFSHSVNVTATALMIGKRLHLNQRDLERLGAGCMLHDIGKIFLDQTTIHADPAMTLAQQYSLQREHPRLGYELLRTRNPDATMINHVALEHHERQDGLGYPRRLRGTNKLDRSLKDHQNIMLISEIATVADIYDMLSTERSGHPTLSPQQISETMHRLSGTFLNREITQHFLSMLTIYPVGMGVIVHSGRYKGFKGVVVRINKKQAEHPQIRLLFNSQGDHIVPIEIDLTRESNIKIEATLSL